MQCNISNGSFSPPATQPSVQECATDSSRPQEEHDDDDSVDVDDDRDSVKSEFILIIMIWQSLSMILIRI